MSKFDIPSDSHQIGRISGYPAWDVQLAHCFAGMKAFRKSADFKKWQVAADEASPVILCRLGENHLWKPCAPSEVNLLNSLFFSLRKVIVKTFNWRQKSAQRVKKANSPERVIRSVTEMVSHCKPNNLSLSDIRFGMARKKLMI